MIRLLIVEDSALMRQVLTQLFTDTGEYELRVCRNGKEALAALPEFAPHVITLDVGLPDTDGLTVLSHIMIERPTPVVMLSSLTAKGTFASLQALALGAIECVEKPRSMADTDDWKADVLAKVRLAAQAHVSAPRPSPRAPARPIEPLPRVVSREPHRVVLIGVSTGGPRVLEDILPALPAHFPWPIVVAQHMPATFTALFAQRMAGLCNLPVVEVTSLRALENGVIYIAHGGGDLQLVSRPGGPMLLPMPQDTTRPWHPSVDALVESALKVFSAPQLVGVLLTGMGDDGACAMKEIHRGGGLTIAESEQSAVVYGMPRALIELGGATRIMPGWAIATALAEVAQTPLVTT